MLELNNCYFVPTLNRNIISASCLEDDSFEFVIKNKCCSIFMNGMYYGRCPVVNGLYVLNLEETESIMLMLREFTNMILILLTCGIVA